MSRITESLYRVNGIELGEGSNRRSKSIRKKRNRFINESKKLTEDADETTLEGCLSYIDYLIGKASESSRKFITTGVDNDVDRHFDSIILGAIFDDPEFYKYCPERNKDVESFLSELDPPLVSTYEYIGEILDGIIEYLEASKEYLQDHWDEF